MEKLKSQKLISSWYNEESLVATEFRRLYSKIRHLNPNKEIKNFLVTSAKMSEGKSTTAALLSITISKYRNTNTLLIDCDLRRPSAHKIFGIPREGGFIDIILGKKDLKSVIKDSFLPSLKILTSGELIKSPSEILNLPNVKNLFAEIKFYFDTIVVDCSPIIPVSDPLILSAEMDGAILVIKAGKTPQGLVKRASQMMKDAGIRVLGIVINNVEDVLPYYYRDRYDYYQGKKSFLGKKM